VGWVIGKRVQVKRTLVIGGSGYVGPVVISKLKYSSPGISVHGIDAGWFADQCERPNRRGYCAADICSGEVVTVLHLAEHIVDEYGRRELLRFAARRSDICVMNSNYLEEIAR
jgi:hypothetical protein